MSWLNLSQYILSMAGVIALISYGWGQWTKGKNESKLDTIMLLKEDVETLKGKVEELTTKVEELTLEITEKDKKLTEVIAILQGRDPQMQEFIRETSPVIAKLNDYLNKQIF